MVYNKTEWKNRVVERPRTFKFQQNADASVTLIPDEGQIIEQGTPVNAENMNKIEQGVADFYEHKANYVKHPGFGVTAGSNNVYTITLDPAPTSYLQGMGVVIAVHADSTGVVTLNVNELGVKKILKSNGNQVNNLKANGVYTLRYNPSADSGKGAFILQGEGGEYGNALAKDVRNTKTFGTENGIQQGALDLTNLVPSNIRQGINIDGVDGTVIEGGMSIPTKYDFTNKRIMAVDKDGKIYLIDTTSSGNGIGRIYDKNMNLLQSITPTIGKNMLGISPNGYCETGSSVDQLLIKNLSGTLLYTINISQGASYNSVFRASNNTLLIQNDTNLNIINMSGTVLNTISASSDAKFMLNKKNNFIYMIFKFGVPNRIGRIVDFSNVENEIWNIDRSSVCFDFQNW